MYGCQAQTLGKVKTKGICENMGHIKANLHISVIDFFYVADQVIDAGAGKAPILKSVGNVQRVLYTDGQAKFPGPVP